jgi:hypothetical protein
MFLPLTDCRFVVTSGTHDAFFTANISDEFPLRSIASRLPASLVLDSQLGARAIRSTATTPLSHPTRLAASDLIALAQLNRILRNDIHYINATQTLWYVKLNVSGSRRLARFPLTLTLAAMHRLSEICRYRPIELSAFLSSQENWLLSEFISAAPGQFLDAIASELTGFQFLLPNVRPAT